MSTNLRGLNHGGLTTMEVAGADAAAITPEFLPFPRQGEREKLSSLKRGTLLNLARDGLIQTVKIRRKGRTGGLRLIVASSLLACLHSLAEERAAARAQGDGGTCN